MLTIPRASCGWVGEGKQNIGLYRSARGGSQGPRCGKERIVKLVLTSHVVSDTPYSVHNTHSAGWVLAKAKTSGNSFGKMTPPKKINYRKFLWKYNVARGNVREMLSGNTPPNKAEILKITRLINYILTTVPPQPHQTRPVSAGEFGQSRCDYATQSLKTTTSHTSST